MTINLPIKKLVDFRRLSEKRQSTFANNLKLPQKPKVKDDDDDDGGDYWVRSISGLRGAYKYNDNALIKEKIDAVLDVYESKKKEQTKNMYQRNLQILYKYEDFDFSIWRPSIDPNFLSKTKVPLDVKNIPIKVVPHHVFSYGSKEDPSVGAILFVTSLVDYDLNELGIFSEAIFKYLSLQHSKICKVDPNFCLTVDASSMQAVSYQQILDGKVDSLFEKTIDTLKKYL
jgi:hypothetical protein